jgi:taurine dioxygenase
MTPAFTIKPITGVIGAEIQGLDITEALNAQEKAELRQALNRYQVLVFRDQPITAQQQHDFALNLGPITLGMVDPGNSPAPGVTVIESSNSKQFADQWHTDQLFAEIPPMAAMLHAVQLPSVGGDTLFSNMADAYDALSAPMKDFLDGLTATNNTDYMMRRFSAGKKNFAYAMDRAEVAHPVVRVHPETGRKSLFVCHFYTQRINELSEAESDAVLQFLFNYIESSEFQMRVTWKPGTTVLWDERSTLHYAMPDYDEKRILNRLMIDGTRPVGVRQLPIAA